MPRVLTDQDKGKQFFIDLGDGTGKEGVYVVPMTDTEKDKLRQRYTKRVATRQGMRDELDSAGFYHARLKNLIKDWVGFEDREGKEIPCTQENIVMLAELNSPLFIEILDSADRLAEVGKEATEKN